MVFIRVISVLTGDGRGWTSVGTRLSETTVVNRLDPYSENVKQVRGQRTG